MLRKMNERIRILLGRDKQIGHFCFLNSISDLEKLADVFQNRIIPLLQEYFYDDWGKIGTVLGNNNFVEEIPIANEETADIMPGDYENYRLLSTGSSDWRNANQYIQIYQGKRAVTRIRNERNDHDKGI